MYINTAAVTAWNRIFHVFQKPCTAVDSQGPRKLSISGAASWSLKGRISRPEWPSIEARKAEEWDPKGQEREWGSWRGGSEPPPHQLRGLGERCKFPQRGLPKLNLVNFSLRIRHLVATNWWFSWKLIDQISCILCSKKARSSISHVKLGSL